MSKITWWIRFVFAGCLAGTAVPAMAASPGPWSLTLEGGLLSTNPEARVRELDVPGSTLGLNHHPGLNALGARGGLTIRRRLGRFAVELGASYSRNTGHGNSGPGFSFNGGVFPRDRPVTSTLETTRIRLEGAWRLAGRGPLMHLQLLAGVEQYHPILTLVADPAITGYDPHEDYLQFFPLPMVGLRTEVAPAPGVRVEGEVRAGTAKNWDTLRSEGGPMRMDLTLVEGDLRLLRPLSSRLALLAGYSFRFADGTLTSPQDGNWIRSREQGLEAGVLWSP